MARSFWQNARNRTGQEAFRSGVRTVRRPTRQFLNLSVSRYTILFETRISANRLLRQPWRTMKPASHFAFLVGRFLLAGTFLMFFAGPLWRASAQLSTIEHLAKPGFWPSKISKASAGFVGSGACAKCHLEIAAMQQNAPMASTLVSAPDAETLHAHPHLNFAEGRYKYEIVTSARGSTYTVTDGARTLSALLRWAFGAGPVGQSYIYEKEGRWYEARVSFFSTVNNLEFTPGRALVSPRNLEEAMARPVSEEQMVRCLRCHATGITQYTPNTSNIFLGVSCEACHGPGAGHVTAMEGEILAAGMPAWEGDDNLIFDPRRLDPTDSIEFCGACHSTWWDVRLSGANGHATLLSPAYRLVNSKCWGKGDKRLECTACHDPHVQRELRPEAYDQKCLACHAREAGLTVSADHPGRACPVSQRKCTSCHMPKVEVPDLHYALTDHDIRIPGSGKALQK